MRDIFVTFVVFATLPYIFKRPQIGILLWSWLAYMNPHKLSWGFAHNFPFSQVTAICIILALFVSKEARKIPWSTELTILVVFIFWMFISTVKSLYPIMAWEQWDKVWKIQLITFITIMVMQNKWRVQAMIWVIALSLGFYGFKGGIFTILTGGAYAVYGPEGTFIYGNNEIGLAMIMTIPLIRYLHLTTTNVMLRRGLLITMWLSVVAVIGTQSRGAFVGISFMGLFLIFKSRNRTPMILLMIILVPLIIGFMPDSWQERMGTIETYEQDNSALGRINAWWMAFNLAKVNLFGGGFECFQTETFFMYAPIKHNVFDAHSVYFEVMGEHGFVGLGLFLLLGAVTLRSCGKMIKAAKKSEETMWLADLGAMIQVSLLGYAASGAFLGLAYFDLYYNLIAIVVICKSLLIRYQQGEFETGKEVEIQVNKEIVDDNMDLRKR
ncbi:MAG: putative O-glycosylation ligase, exosortase A system-associated [Methyloprofundus sp.]|nr:putative O-glycosylation ligase, exosortase A system-associated [Methyloprofundus sp.]